MPPKVKITKKSIIATALELVRIGGASAVNARSIANALGCSTQPIFSNFDRMDELEEALILEAYARYQSITERELSSNKYPPYKSSGMAYILFAKEEKELFKLLFMCDREGKAPILTEEFNSIIEMVMQANNISRERAELMHLEMWATVHGIATMFATSFLDLDMQLVSDMLSDIYLGLRTRYTTEGIK